MKQYNCPDCALACDSCKGCPRADKVNTLEEVLEYDKLCPINGSHEWEYNGLDTIGSIFICKHCGQRKHIPYKPYPYYNYATTSTDAIPPACRGCSNHPSNGGSGICHCIMGNQTTVIC